MDYDYIAIFDADFKPDPDFLVGGCSSCCAPVHASCRQPRPQPPVVLLVHYSSNRLLQHAWYTVRS